jgi:hypothetical protein
MKKTTKQKNVGYRASALAESKPQANDLTCRNYAVNASTLDESTRSVEAVIATETPVLAFDMRTWSPVNEILLMSGVRMPESKQIPLLDSHSRFSVGTVLGSTRNLRIEGDSLIGRNYFSKRQAAEDAYQMTREGHLTDNSIGYRLLKYTTIEPGQSAEISGRKFTAPKEMGLRVVTEWQLFENSIVPIGADQLAKVRSEAEPVKINKPFLKEYRSMNFEQWLQQRGLTLDALDERQAAAWRQVFDDEQKRSVQKTQTDEASLIEQGRKAELKRQADIKTLAGNAVPAELVERAINDQWSVDQAKTEFLAALRTSQMYRELPTGVAVHTTSQDVSGRTLEAAMLLRAGLQDAAVKGYGEKVAEEADRIRDISLVDVCREALALSGKVIARGKDEMIRSAFSTVTLPQILGNVANKALLAGYNALPATWEKWCRIGSVSDFKTNTRVRMTDVGELQQVGNGGEVQHGSASEEYETFSIASYAKQFTITRQNIINDDLGVFTAVPQKMGTKANQKVAQLVYAHLLNPGNMADGVALFQSANHKNLNTSSALTDAKLSASILAFRNQVDADGQPISVEPRFLIVPPSLERTARMLVESDLLIATALGSTSAAATSGNKNILRGVMEVIVEPRLENSNYTGYSATTWYVAADPATIDTVEVAFLNGKRTPTVERFDTDINVMGVGFRVFIDCGVKALDYRGLQKNTA